MFLNIYLIGNLNVSTGKNRGGEMLLAGERALTEFGSNFEPRRDSLQSDVSMNTQQNCAALEQ